MSAEQHISPQDYELLSAYIDGELTDAERETVDQRLVSEPILQQELTSLRNTVNLINQLQPMAAPRNFTLTADMITPKNVIRLQPRRRRVRPDYLSLVASVLLMLFGALFMLSELSQPPPTANDAPVSIQQSEPAEAQMEAPAVANAPTEVTDETSQANRIIDDGAVEQPSEGDALEKIETEEIEMSDLQPLLNTTLADDNGASPELTLGSNTADESLAGGEGFSGTDSEQAMDTFAFEESEGMADGDETTETQLFDAESDVDLGEEGEEPPAAAGGMLSQTAPMTDTVTGADDRARDDLEVESDDAMGAITSSVSTTASATNDDNAVGRMMEPTPTDMLQSPPEPSTNQPTDTSFSGVEIGLGLLAVGLLLWVASLIMIRRNRS